MQHCCGEIIHIFWGEKREYVQITVCLSISHLISRKPYIQSYNEANPKEYVKSASLANVTSQTTTERVKDYAYRFKLARNEFSTKSALFSITRTFS